MTTVHDAAILSLKKSLICNHYFEGEDGGSKYRKAVFCDIDSVPSSWQKLRDSCIGKIVETRVHIENMTILLQYVQFSLSRNTPKGDHLLPLVDFWRPDVLTKFEASRRGSAEISFPSNSDSSNLSSAETVFLRQGVVMSWKSIGQFILDRIANSFLGSSKQAKTLTTSDKSTNMNVPSILKSFSKETKGREGSNTSRQIVLSEVPLISSPERSFQQIIEQNIFWKILFLSSRLLTSIGLSSILGYLITFLRPKIILSILRNAIPYFELLTPLLVASVEEDIYGMVQRDISSIIHSYFFLLVALDRLLRVPQFSHAAFNVESYDVVNQYQSTFKNGIIQILSIYQDPSRQGQQDDGDQATLDSILSDWPALERQSLWALLNEDQ